MAMLIKSDGSEQEVKPKGTKFTLEEMQGFVGGYIEYVKLSFLSIMVVNEDGRVLELPINKNATNILQRNLGAGTVDIVGDVLVATNKELGIVYDD